MIHKIKITPTDRQNKLEIVIYKVIIEEVYITHIIQKNLATIMILILMKNLAHVILRAKVCLVN